MQGVPCHGRLVPKRIRWGLSSLILVLGLHLLGGSTGHAIASPTPNTSTVTSGLPTYPFIASDRPLLAPPTQRTIRLRRGPYFPNLEVLTPPLPDPIFPEIVYPIRLVIRLSERRVYVYRGDVVQTSYPIAVGKPGWETPVGQYEVMNMQIDPSWKNPFTGAVIPPGGNNPLGDRWIGFWSDGTNVIGFHGTPNEGSVGRAASHGCVRMLNRDIRELYTIAEVGMPVTVEP